MQNMSTNGSAIQLCYHFQRTTSDHFKYSSDESVMWKLKQNQSNLSEQIRFYSTVIINNKG